MTKTQLTCTCSGRYVMDAEHEGDCDLWLIDEFWAGFLAWDWDREVLVPTSTYPPNHESDYVDSVEWIDDYLQQKDARQYGVEGMSNAQLGMSDEDIMLTTDAFIDRMIANHPEDEDDTWIKDDTGLWKKVVKNHDGGTTTTYGGRGNLPATYHSTGSSKWDNDGYDWNSWVSDRHTQTPIHFPDETTVYGTSLSRANERETTPDFALYLDGGWRAEGMAIMLPWRDYGLPSVSNGMAYYAIREAFSWAKAGAFVEVGCIGAHGRTGTVLACMALLADPALTATEAVAFVRTAYCQHAIETREQEWFVACFEADEKGTPAPPKPVYVAPKPTVVTSSAGTALPKPTSGAGTTASRSAGPLGDPNRKGKARRSRRGGKRQQKHRARMAQGSRR